MPNIRDFWTALALAGAIIALVMLFTNFVHF